jgi:bifunctional DNase/RNase
MKDIELNITALNSSTTGDKNFVVVLQEANGARRLPIIIGLQEAQAIAIALEKLQPPRPLTHDLFLNTIAVLKANLAYVKITELNNGIYRSVIAVQDTDQNIMEIDSRTSDAIALAARERCSIFISDELLNETAFIEPPESRILAEKRIQLEQYATGDLYDILADLLEKEDYEGAGIVRDILSKRELDKL